MKKAFLLISVVFTLFSCKDGDKYNGLVLVDPNTGIKYLLKYNGGDSYFVDKISTACFPTGSFALS